MEELLINILIAVVGLAVLIKGSDYFVNAAEKMGLALGLSPFVVGVLILGFGTSLPELAASMAAVWSGDMGIVAGNAIGSNIANIALIIGVTAIIAGKIRIEKGLSGVDISLLLSSAFLTWFVFMDGVLVKFEAVIFILCLGIVVAHSATAGSLPTDTDKVSEKVKVRGREILLLMVGMAMVIGGAKFAVDAIIIISENAGVSTEIISLGVVALGTSLPELAVSIAAARAGKPEIAVGNIVGSNLFNTFAVLGIPALFTDIGISQEMTAIHIPLMIVLTVLFSFMCFVKKISRWEGCILLLFYIIFMAKLFEGVGLVN